MLSIVSRTLYTITISRIRQSRPDVIGNVITASIISPSCALAAAAAAAAWVAGRCLLMVVMWSSCRVLHWPQALLAAAAAVTAINNDRVDRQTDGWTYREAPATTAIAYCTGNDRPSIYWFTPRRPNTLKPLSSDLCSDCCKVRTN